MGKAHITREEQKAADLAKYFNLGTHQAAVTKSDSATFEPSAIVVGSAGTLTVTDCFGVSLEWNVTAGYTLPLLCTQVKTGGTASNIIRVW